MIVKIKGASSGNWFMFDADEVEWEYFNEKMKESGAFEQAHRIFFNEKEVRVFYYLIFLRREGHDYKMFLINTEVYILNNDGKTVEVLR